MIPYEVDQSEQFPNSKFAGGILPGQSIARQGGNVRYANTRTTDASGYPLPRVSYPQSTVTPLAQSETIRAASNDQYDNEQRNRMLGNMGILPRGPSPQFAAMQQGKMQRGGDTGPQVDPALVQRAHENNQNFIPHPVPFTEQQARMMWMNIVGRHGADYGKAADEFNSLMQAHGHDGQRTLEDWKKEGSLLQFDFPQPGQFSPATNIPISMLGTDKGGTTSSPNFTTPFQDENGAVVTPQKYLTSPSMPVMGPQPGYTPLRMASQGYPLPGMNRVQPTGLNGEPMPTTKPSMNTAQTPSAPTSAPSTTMSNLPVSRGNATIIDPSFLPQAPTSPNMLQQALDAPVRAMQAKQQGAIDLANANNASHERQAQTHANATTQAAQTTGQSRVDAASVGQGRATKDPFTTYHEGKVRTAQLALAAAQRTYGMSADDASKQIITQHAKDLKDAQDAQYDYLQTKQRDAAGNAQPAPQAAPAPTARSQPVNTYGAQPTQTGTPGANPGGVVVGERRPGPSGILRERHADGLWYPVQ